MIREMKGWSRKFEDPILRRTVASKKATAPRRRAAA
jgi:hypothetical protein